MNDYRVDLKLKRNSITKDIMLSDLKLHSVNANDNEFELCYKLIHLSESLRYILVCAINKNICYSIVNKELEELSLINKSESRRINKILKCRNMLVHSQLNGFLLFSKLKYISYDIKLLEEVLRRTIEKIFKDSITFKDQSYYMPLLNELNYCRENMNKLENISFKDTDINNMNAFN